MRGFLLIIAVLFLNSQSLYAEIYGTPPTVPESLSPGPNTSAEGSGSRFMSQGCSYGSTRAAATYTDDPIVKEILKDMREGRIKKKKSETELYRLEKSLAKDKEDLAKLLETEDAEDFALKASQCAGDFIKFKRSSAQDKDQEMFSLFQGRDFFGACENPQVGNFPGCNASAARCHKAFTNSKGQFNFSELCYGRTPNNAHNADWKKGEIPSISNDARVAKCARLTKNLTDKMMKRDVLAKKIEDEEALAQRLEEKRDAAKERFEEEQERIRESGEDRISADGAGVRDCPAGDGECLILRAKQMRESQNNTGKWIFAGAMIDSLIQGAANISIARGNRNLGYPTGPNPYVTPMVGMLQSFLLYNQMSNMNMGYPFNYGNVYGGTMGGMGAGSWGCSPNIYGAQGSSFGPAGNPYGGLFNNGFIPGYGFAGPGYFNGGGAMNPYAMQCMQSGANCGGFGGIGSILNGILGPYGQMQLGNQANMMGYPGNGYFGNPFTSAIMGGNPYGGGGFGGFNPYGMGGAGGAGFPFGGAGGFGGAGYPFGGGAGGAFGANGNPQYQMQMLNQQMQAMQTYQAQLQAQMAQYNDYIQRQMQATQLMQQAYSIMGSGSMSGNYYGNMSGSLGFNMGVNPMMGTQYMPPTAGSMGCTTFPCPGLVGNPGGSNR